MKFLILSILLSPVINELMINPLGPETGALSPGDRNEFVEIYNAGDDTLDLSFYKLKDNYEIDTLVPFPDSIKIYYPDVVCDTRVPPGGYALILDREYIVEGENFLPYEIKAGTRVLTTGDTDIGNGLSSRDTIMILDGNGMVVSSYGTGNGLPLEPPDGISVERRIAEEGDYLANWRFSVSPEGCTPGYRNSVSREIDILLDSLWIAKLEEEGSFRIFLKIFNNGINPINEFSVIYKLDDVIEKQRGAIFILPDSMVEWNFEITNIPAGCYKMEVKLEVEGDEDTSNQKGYVDFYWGDQPLVINEIMYDADVEWIEIYNAQDSSFDIQGFRVGDMAGNISEPVDTSVLIPPHGYIVLSADTFSCNFCIVLRDFPGLNNTEETVYLLSSSGFIFDSVHYSYRWGGGDGVSLERLSPYLPSSSPSNWASSKTGSTPAEENSVRIDFRKSENILELSGKLISPREGKDRIIISYAIPEAPVYVDITAYRIDGKMTKRILEAHYSSTGRGETFWDGKNEAGMLKEGIYILVLKARTENGRLYKSRKVVAIAP